VATSGSKRQSTTSGGNTAGRAKTNGTAQAQGTAGADGDGHGATNGDGSGASTAGRSAAGGATASGGAKRRSSAASAAGTTARARIGGSRLASARAARAGRTQAKSAAGPGKRVTASVAEPTTTVPADDSVLAASNTNRALSPDMPRVAWLRSQLQQMETQQRERLIKVAQLTLIAILFITFVLQNAHGVNVHFLLFALNIRLIWVIFGCGFLGGVAGYLIGRPDKSLRALLPQKHRGKSPASTDTTRA
jgi:uncharacterized integral membrane protein